MALLVLKGKDGRSSFTPATLPRRLGKPLQQATGLTCGGGWMSAATMFPTPAKWPDRFSARPPQSPRVKAGANGTDLRYIHSLPDQANADPIRRSPSVATWEVC